MAIHESRAELSKQSAKRVVAATSCRLSKFRASIRSRPQSMQRQFVTIC